VWRIKNAICGLHWRADAVIARNTMESKLCIRCDKTKLLKHFEIKGASLTGKVWRRNVCNSCLEKQRCVSDVNRKQKREKSRTKDRLIQRWQKRDRRYIKILHKTYIKSLLRKQGIFNPTPELMQLKKVQIILKREIYGTVK